MAVDKRTKAAIDKAAEAARHAPEQYRERCFEAVLRVELGLPLDPTRPARSGEVVPPRPAPRGRPSLSDFLRQKAPRNERDTALVITYYREEHQRAAQTTKDDLDAAFSEVAPGTMKRIGHPAQVLRDAKRARYVKSQGRGAFALTNRGSKRVEETLPHGTAN